MILDAKKKGETHRARFRTCPTGWIWHVCLVVGFACLAGFAGFAGRAGLRGLRGLRGELGARPTSGLVDAPGRMFHVEHWGLRGLRGLRGAAYAWACRCACANVPRGTLGFAGLAGFAGRVRCAAYAWAYGACGGYWANEFVFTCGTPRFDARRAWRGSAGSAQPVESRSGKWHIQTCGTPRFDARRAWRGSAGFAPPPPVSVEASENRGQFAWAFRLWGTPRFDAGRARECEKTPESGLWKTCGKPVNNLLITRLAPLATFALRRLIHKLSTSCPQVINKLSTGLQGGVDNIVPCFYTM
jgi:hypothetical protein